VGSVECSLHYARSSIRIQHVIDRRLKYDYPISAKSLIDYLNPAKEPHTGRRS
jgi:hypothetical protein